MKMKYIVIALLFSNIIWSQNLSSHKWKERIIVIKADESNAALANSQFNMLVAEKEKLIDRKMVVYKCISGQCEFYNGLNPAKFLKIDNINAGYSAVLIGFDGGKKYTSKKVVMPDVFFELIDKMPMRRQELRDKEK